MIKKPPNIKIKYIDNNFEEINNPQNINNLYKIYWSIEEKDFYTVGFELSHFNNVSKPLIPHEENWTSSPDNEFYFYCKLDNEGLPHGDCSIWSKYNNETYAEGRYKHGLLDGCWINKCMAAMVDPWEVAEMNFKNGKLHGPFQMSDDSSPDNLCIGNYSEGKAHGLFKFFVYKEIEMSEEEWDRLSELWDHHPEMSDEERDKLLKLWEDHPGGLFDELYETEVYEVHYDNGKLVK